MEIGLTVLSLLGVLTAVHNVNHVIGPQCIAAEIDPRNQEVIDAFLLQLDGTPSKCSDAHWLVLPFSPLFCL
jgi:enolase